MTASPILESAIECARLGLSVHFQKGKNAFELGWNSGPPKTEAQLQRDYQAGWNIGFQTGHRSMLNGLPVGVLDPDLRSKDPRHAAEMDAALRELVGGMEPTVRTGSGGSHFYFAMDGKILPTKTLVLRRSNDEIEWREDGQTKQRPAWAIEFLWAGHACTLPPSIHPDTGNRYTWVNGGLSKVGPPPDTLLKALQAAEPTNNPPPGGWPKREPINAELKPVPPFDPTLLPEALRAWIMDEAERMPCPPDFIAAPVTVMISSIVGARCGVRPKSHDSWTVVPNLWGGVVGLPSTKKSPAIAVAMKPLGRLTEIVQKIHENELHAHAIKKAIHEAKIKLMEARLTAAVKAAAKGGKGEDTEMMARALQELREEEPTPPNVPRFKSNDSTVEKLGELLRDNPRGLLMARDELVGLMASWEREGREGDRAFFLEAFNGDQSFDTDRIGRGHIHIPNLCLSLFGGIQPDKRVSRHGDWGARQRWMLQRFQMLVFPDHRNWEWRDEAPDPDARERAYETIERLASFDPVAWGATPAGQYDKFPAFRFKDDAQRIFIQWSIELHDRINGESDPLIQQHLSKYDKLFPALALLFHLIDCAAHGVRGPITRTCAIRAAGWCEYLEAHARRCYGLLKDSGLRSAQALARKLERGELKNGFTAREVRRHQWTDLKTERSVETAIEWVEDCGWVRRDRPTHGQAGRPTTRYEIHPDLNGGVDE
jgi:Protein of unknown function (DUF3987)/Bifunctional DNA primase/polymerase, N-terminal